MAAAAAGAGDRDRRAAAGPERAHQCRRNGRPTRWECRRHCSAARVSRNARRGRSPALFGFRFGQYTFASQPSAQGKLLQCAPPSTKARTQSRLSSGQTLPSTRRRMLSSVCRSAASVGPTSGTTAVNLPTPWVRSGTSSLALSRTSAQRSAGSRGETWSWLRLPIRMAPARIAALE